jgi:hypothetical protein
VHKQNISKKEQNKRKNFFLDNPDNKINKIEVLKELTR